MKLPKSVRVGSMVYKILDMPEEMHELSEAMGLCDKQHLIIHIYPKQAQAKLWSTLWHEIKHAMFEESGMTLKGEEEEDIVGHLERMDCMVFRDNPTLMKNLIKVLRGKDNLCTD